MAFQFIWSRVRSPYWYLVGCWVSLILFGANCAIDLLAIPLNFRLPMHVEHPEIAVEYGLALFTSFFAVETFFIDIVILSQALGPKHSQLGWRDRCRLASLCFLIFYVFYQRRFLLPEFEALVRQGSDSGVLHQKLSIFETMKIMVLLLTTFVCHKSYQQHRLRL